jgi:glyoxalase family protein
MPGIHHVTAISGAPERNLDFYKRVLGLRLVKKTVNFDDPGTYHLYYGDGQGTPGTILTFFPWAHAAPGRLGVGETQETAFRVPAASLGYWAHRFIQKGVTHGALEKRFGETVLTFADPDGMHFSLVGVAGAGTEPDWSGGGIPAEHAIRGFHGVTLLLGKAAPTAKALTGVFGFRAAERRARLRATSPAIRSAGTSIYVRPASFRAAGLGAARCIMSHSAHRATRRRPRWPKRRWSSAYR